MRLFKLALISVLTHSSFGSWASARPQAACDLPTVEYEGQLEAVLSQRAVDAVNLAMAESGEASRSTLAKFVAQSASFSIIRGDAIYSLKPGPEGLVALARNMKSVSFRFLRSNASPRPIDDPCSTRKVSVEFTASKEHLVFLVTFTFVQGKIVDAQAEERWFTSGAMNSATE